jgi:hypothetical protein
LYGQYVRFVLEERCVLAELVEAVKFVEITGMGSKVVPAQERADTIARHGGYLEVFGRGCACIKTRRGNADNED